MQCSFISKRQKNCTENTYTTHNLQIEKKNESAAQTITILAIATKLVINERECSHTFCLAFVYEMSLLFDLFIQSSKRNSNTHDPIDCFEMLSLI